MASKREIRNIVIAASGQEYTGDQLTAEQIYWVMSGLVALGVDKDCYLVRYWNIDEYETIEDAVDFLYRNKHELPF